MVSIIEPLLSAPRVEAVRILFLTLDQEASDAQHRFNQVMVRANQMVLVAGIASGLLLASGILAARWDSVPWLGWLPTPFGVVGGIAGVFGTMWLHQAKEGQSLRRWMRKRAQAEAARRDYVMALVREPGPPEANPAEIDLAKLDHIRREHIEDQRNYYRRRAAEHRASAERTLRLGGIAAGFGALAAFTAGAAALAEPSAAALGSLSVIGAALATFATAREEIHQDRRNAERYEDARDALTILLGKTGEVGAAIQAGATDALATYVAAAHEALLAEHQQWLAVEERIAGTLDRLEGELARQRKAAQARGASPPAAEPRPAQGG